MVRQRSRSVVTVRLKNKQLVTLELSGAKRCALSLWDDDDDVIHCVEFPNEDIGRAEIDKWIELWDNPLTSE